MTHHLDLSQALLITVVVVVDLHVIIAGIDHYPSQVPLQIEHITIISSHQLDLSSDYYSEKHCSCEHYLEIFYFLLLLTHLLRRLKKIDYLLPPPIPPALIPLLHNLNF